MFNFIISFSSIFGEFSKKESSSDGFFPFKAKKYEFLSHKWYVSFTKSSIDENALEIITSKVFIL